MQCSGVKLAVLSTARLVRLSGKYHEVHSTQNIAQRMHLQRVDRLVFAHIFIYMLLLLRVTA
jgi:hypothetical protein